MIAVVMLNDALDNIRCYVKSIRFQGNTGQQLKKGNAGSTPYLVRPWHKRMLEDAAVKVSYQHIVSAETGRDDEMRQDIPWVGAPMCNGRIERSTTRKLYVPYTYEWR